MEKYISILVLFTCSQFVSLTPFTVRIIKNVYIRQGYPGTKSQKHSAILV